MIADCVVETQTQGVEDAAAIDYVTANLTVTDQTKAGYVSLTPIPTATPGTSTINFPLGDNRANGVTIPLGPGGSAAAVFKASSGSVDLILDVTGYFTGGGGLLFHPLNPGRRVDTRQPLGSAGLGNGLSGAQGDTPRTVVIAGHFGVPPTAAAITGNLTVTGQSGYGIVAVTPTSAVPNTSTINFPPGDSRANGITTPLGSSVVWFWGALSVSGGTVQLILDITGYFQ